MSETSEQYELVVVESFGSYAKGDIITDAQSVHDILSGEWQHHVVKKAAAPE
jgi:hypothetical protein